MMPACWRHALAQPLMTLKVVAGIGWNAAARLKACRPSAAAPAPANPSLLLQIDYGADVLTLGLGGLKRLLLSLPRRTGWRLADPPGAVVHQAAG
jgi:hypothetical protein